MKQLEKKDDAMRDEYDFSKSERAPYATLAGNVHIVELDGDVWETFPDSEAVNRALRGLMKQGAGKSAASGELSKAS